MIPALREHEGLRYKFASRGSLLEAGIVSNEQTTNEVQPRNPRPLGQQTASQCQ